MCLQQHPLVGSVCSDASPEFPAVEASDVRCLSGARSRLSPLGNLLALGCSLISHLLPAAGLPCHLTDSHPHPICSARKTPPGKLSCRSRIKTLSQPMWSCELGLLLELGSPCRHLKPQLWFGMSRSKRQAGQFGHEAGHGSPAVSSSSTGTRRFGNAVPGLTAQPAKAIQLAATGSAWPTSGVKCKEFVSPPPDGKGPDPQLYPCTDFIHLYLPKTCSSLSSYNNNQRKPGQIFLCCCDLAICLRRDFQVSHCRYYT